LRKAFRRTVVVSACALLLSACSGDAERPPESESVSSPIQEGNEQTSELSAAMNALPQPGFDVSMVIKVTSLADGEQSLKASGSVVDDSATLEVDARAAPNGAGFFGHYDTIDALFVDDSGYFAVVPEDKWLRIDLDSASSFEGADIARLRDLTLANPLLIVQLLEETGDVSFQGDAGSLVMKSDSSGTMAELEELFGIHRLPIDFAVDDQGALSSVEVIFEYEMVRDTEAINRAVVTLEITGPSDADPAEAPPTDDVMEL
jgi:hypothetical protein